MANKLLIIALFIIWGQYVNAQNIYSVGATSAANDYYSPVFDNSNNMYFIEYDASFNGCIYKLTSSGVLSALTSTLGGYSGDGGLAIYAGVSPFFLAIDNAGDVFFSDNNNNVIREITIAGIIKTVAGNASLFTGPGYSGDGALATLSQLNEPTGIAIDNFGNLFISDGYNRRIRKVDHITGIISTFAGNGIPGFADNSTGSVAEIYTPMGLKFNADKSFLYFADEYNYRVRKIDMNGTNAVSTVAGSGTAGATGDGGNSLLAELDQPTDISLDNAGNLYISVQCRIRQVDLSGNIHTVVNTAGSCGTSGDGGLAIDAQVNPFFICSDAIGNIGAVII